jgi:hypothetical protein
MTQIDLPKIRVGVDWNGDGWIDYDDLSTDPLNTFPDNGILRDDQSMAVGADVEWYVVKSASLDAFAPSFGEYCYHILPHGAGTKGVAFSTQSNFYATNKTTASVFQSGSVFLAAGTYTLTSWVATNGASTTITMEVYDETEYEVGGGFTANASVVSATPSDWQKLELTFTVPSGGRYLHISFTQAANVEILVGYKVMLLSGSTGATKWNDGTLNLYDNITDDLVSVRTKIGRSTPDDLFPSEGTVTIQVDNSERKYSPENTASPLYGLLTKNKRIHVDIEVPDTNPVEYTRIWTGWINNIEVTTGRYSGDGMATISGGQGISRFNELKPVLGVQTDVTLTNVLEQILEYGWIPSGVVAGVGDYSYLDKNMYFVDLTEFLSTTTTDVTTFPVVGDGWGEDTTAHNMLREILDVDRSWFFLDRNGSLVYNNRHFYKSIELFGNELAENEVTDTDYVYGGKVSNVIKVSYYPKEYVDGSIWTSKQRLVVPRGTEKEFEMSFEYEEGTTITVTELLPFQVGSSTIEGYNRAVGGTLISEARYVVRTELNNGSGKIIIKNNHGGPLYFDVDLHGTRMVSFGSQTHYSELEESSYAYASLQTEGKKELSVNNKLIDTEEDAIYYGDYLLARYGLPRSQFVGFRLKSRNATWLQRQLDLTLGSVVRLEDYQVAFNQYVNLNISR